MHIFTILILSLFTLYSNVLTHFSIFSPSHAFTYHSYYFSFHSLFKSTNFLHTLFSLSPMHILTILFLLPSLFKFDSALSVIHILTILFLSLYTHFKSTYPPPSLSLIYILSILILPLFLFLFASLDICTPNFSVFLVNEFILQVSMNKCFLTAPLLQPCIRLRSIK